LLEPFGSRFPNLTDLLPSPQEMTIEELSNSLTGGGREIMVKVLGVEVPLNGPPYVVGILAGKRWYEFLSAAYRGGVGSQSLLAGAVAVRGRALARRRGPLAGNRVRQIQNDVPGFSRELILEASRPSSKDLAEEIAACPRPVVIVDTCSLLDVFRSAFRNDVEVAILNAALDLVDDVQSDHPKTWVDPSHLLASYSACVLEYTQIVGKRRATRDVHHLRVPRTSCQTSLLEIHWRSSCS